MEEVETSLSAAEELQHQQVFWHSLGMESGLWKPENLSNVDSLVLSLKHDQ